MKRFEGETWAHYCARRSEDRMRTKKYLKGALVFDSTGNGKKGRTYIKSIYGPIGEK